MAELNDKITTGILGDIKPNESARDHLPGGDGNDEEQDDAAKQATQVGTRNYHSTGGAAGGDLGNRPE